MKLIFLALENFRQHKDSRIEFNDGITIITGANGSGKSTILEAISWAIYGTEAARGNKDSIKWNKAPARSKVRVELIFALDNEIFRVVRELNKAEVFLGENQSPLAISQDEVTKYLTEKLGMSRIEFFNTYFTGQKELNFLGNQKTIDKKRFISKVLNYELIKEAQDGARFDKNNLISELNGIKQGLGNIETVQEEKEQAQKQKDVITEIFIKKQDEFYKYTLEQGNLMPEWTKIKNAREDYNKNNTELKFIIDKIIDIDKNILNLKIEDENIDLKSRKLQELEPLLEKYKEIEKSIAVQEKLQKYEFEKQKLLANIENTNNELIKLNAKFDTIHTSAENKKEIPAKIIYLKEKIDLLKEKIKKETKDWTSQKQEITTIKKQKDADLNKLAKQYSIIEQKGENGTCPTCERPLKGEFEKVTGQFKEQIKVLSIEISYLVLKEESLSAEPVEILQNQKTLKEYEIEYEKSNKLHGQLERNSTI